MSLHVVFSMCVCLCIMSVHKYMCMEHVFVCLMYSIDICVVCTAPV